MTNHEETEPERLKRLELRNFETLKHISTLSVATLVLLLALVKDFSPVGLRTDPPLLTLLTLVSFCVSLTFAMGGLFIHVTQGQDARKGVGTSTKVAYGFFLAGLGAAVFLGSTTL